MSTDVTIDSDFFNILVKEYYSNVSLRSNCTWDILFM